MAYNEKLATQSFVQESIEGAIKTNIEITNKIEKDNQSAITSNAIYEELNSFYKYNGKTIKLESEGTEIPSDMKPNEYCEVYIPAEGGWPRSLAWSEYISGPVTIGTNDVDETEISMQLTTEQCKELELMYNTNWFEDYMTDFWGEITFYPIIDGIEGNPYSDLGRIDVDIDNGIAKIVFYDLEVPECSFAKVRTHHFEMYLNKNGKLIKNQYYGYKFIKTSDVNYTIEIENDNVTIPTGAAVYEAIENAKEQMLTDISTVHVMGEAAHADTGFAGGQEAYTLAGFAGGENSSSIHGGAVGNTAFAENGFSGGREAWGFSNMGYEIDTIQLGTGRNPNEHTLQVYDYQLLDEQGKIPNDRLKAKYQYMGEYLLSELPNRLTISDKGNIYKIIENGTSNFENVVINASAGYVSSVYDHTIALWDYYEEYNKYLSEGTKITITYYDDFEMIERELTTTIIEKQDYCIYKLQDFPENAFDWMEFALTIIIDQLEFKTGEYAYWNGVQWEVKPSLSASLIGDIEAALDESIALCDSYISWEVPV